MLGNGGRYLEIGNVSPLKTVELDPAMLVINGKSIVGVALYNAAALKKSLDFLSRAKDRYPFEKILCCTYPLDDIERAFKEQDQGLATRTSIVF
jgi:Zn-dependent alcohol dehydrogenase